MGSDNPFGADDQQERSGLEGWIVGFVDGEGCFSCPITRNPSARIGWQVQPRFVVVQGARSAHVLADLRQYFGCGKLYRNRRQGSHREDVVMYSVFRSVDLRERIVPFFEANPLHTAKRLDFERFARILQLMTRGDHLTIEGLTEIARIAGTMNRRRPSRFLESSEAIRQPPPVDVRR